MAEEPSIQDREDLRLTEASAAQEQQLADLLAQIAAAKKNIGEMYQRTKDAERADAEEKARQSTEETGGQDA